MIRTYAKNTKDPILALGLLPIVRHQEGSHNVGPSVHASPTISSPDSNYGCASIHASQRDGEKDEVFFVS